MDDYEETRSLDDGELEIVREAALCVIRAADANEQLLPGNSVEKVEADIVRLMEELDISSEIGSTASNGIIEVTYVGENKVDLKVIVGEIEFEDDEYGDMLD